MTLSNAQRTALSYVWSEFDEREITYVVLRGYEALPRAIAGSDVDMLVDAESFDDAVAVCKRAFESTESIPRNALDLTSLVVASPLAVARNITRSPAETAATAKNRLLSSAATGRGYVERAFDAAGVQIHLTNHFAYESPMDGSRIRVDPVIEDAMFDHRIEREAFYTPAPPDELAHLVCRGVFDYGGEFPDRYVDRCGELFAEVRADAAAADRFHDLLSQLFFDADTLVYDLVAAADYDRIRSTLREYSDY